MSPDTQQNIIVALYLIVLHNFVAIVYSVGILGTTIWALYKPTRGKILILWGFIFLLFAFEYNKHILEPLKEQTLNSLITERQSLRIEYIVNKTFTRAVPIALPILGWMLIISGIFFDKITRTLRKYFMKNHVIPAKAGIQTGSPGQARG